MNRKKKDVTGIHVDCQVIQTGKQTDLKMIGREGTIIQQLLIGKGTGTIGNSHTGKRIDLNEQWRIITDKLIYLNWQVG